MLVAFSLSTKGSIFAFICAEVEIQTSSIDYQLPTWALDMGEKMLVGDLAIRELAGWRTVAQFTGASASAEVTTVEKTTIACGSVHAWEATVAGEEWGGRVGKQ